MDFKETAESITLHGLGFLQIKLPGNQRLHVWHPDLPRRKCFKDSNIHSHRFSFTSRVLVGEQINQDYSIHSIKPCDTTHDAYIHRGDRTKFGNRPWDLVSSLEVIKGDRRIVKPGEEYQIKYRDFHSTECDGICVTLMIKTYETNEAAHSLCKIGVDPDVDFDRKQWSEAQLWNVFKDAMAA